MTNQGDDVNSMGVDELVTFHVPYVRWTETYARSVSLAELAARGVAWAVARMRSRARPASLFDFVDGLAALYADLWFSGRLDQVREESTDDDG